MKRAHAAIALLAACTTHVDLGDRRLEPPVASVQTTWLGNAGGRARASWMQRTVSHLHTQPDGTLVAMGIETELGADFRNNRLIRDGEIVGTLGDLDGNETGAAAVSDAQFLYAAVAVGRAGIDGATAPPPRTKLHCIRRYGFDRRPAPFPGGVGADGSFLLVEKVADAPTGIATLAVGAGELYVAHGADAATVSVYALPNLTPVRSFVVRRAPSIAIDAGGTLWIADDPTGTSVGRFDREGHELPGRLAGFRAVAALATNARGELLVADGGTAQQVIVFEDLAGTPRRARAIGIEGGLSSSAGRDVRPDRFMGVTSVTSDVEGNVYVGMNVARTHLGRIVSLGPAGDARWEISALASQDTAALDADGDDAQIFSRYARFVVDGAAVRWAGWTYDWLRYPDDPRGRVASAAARLVRVGGTRLLLDNSGDALSLFRFDPAGETAVPALTIGGFSAADTGAAPGPGLWIDDDGDGHRSPGEIRARDSGSTAVWLDEDGTIWTVDDRTGVVAYPLAGVDARGIPSYDVGARVRRPMPPEIRIVRRIVVVAREHAAYVGAYTAESPNLYPGLEWQSIGSDVLRYDGWPDHPTLTWRQRIVFDGPERKPFGLAVADDRLFVAFANTGELRAFDARRGTDLGRLQPGPDVGGLSELGRGEMPISAQRRRNGEYVLIAADAFRSANAIVRLPPVWP